VPALTRLTGMGRLRVAVLGCVASGALALTACAAPGSGVGDGGGAASPDHDYEAVAQWAAEVADAWSSAPRGDTWQRGYVPLQDPVVVKGTLTDAEKQALVAGWWRSVVALPPARPPDGAVTFPDGTMTVPLLSAAEAFRQMDLGDPPPCSSPATPPLPGSGATPPDAPGGGSAPNTGLPGRGPNAGLPGSTGGGAGGLPAGTGDAAGWTSGGAVGSPAGVDRGAGWPGGESAGLPTGTGGGAGSPGGGDTARLAEVDDGGAGWVGGGGVIAVPPGVGGGGAGSSGGAGAAVVVPVRAGGAHAGPPVPLATSGPDTSVSTPATGSCAELTVSGVSLGTTEVRTSRGLATVPAWRFEIGGGRAVFRVAVANPAPAPSPVPTPANRPAPSELVAVQDVTSVKGKEVEYRLGVGACDHDITPVVVERPDVVVLAGGVRRGEGICTDQLLLEPVTVTLDEPLGDRPVLDARNGTLLTLPE